MRVAASLAVLAVVGCALVGCGGHGGPRTSLTIRAVNPSVGRAVFHVDCGPTGGDVPDPGKACAALTAEPVLLSAPKPFVCPGGTFSWWDVTIAGRLDGRPLRRSFSTCWTPQMAMIGRLGLRWDVLQKHLLPRREGAVLAGTKHTFPAGKLQPSDLVTCDILGHRLEMGVPEGAGTASTATGVHT